MKTNVVISSRGQLTLPSEVRKKFGIAEGSVMTIEEREGEIILKPAAVFEIEYYTDKQIQDWVKADQLSEVERTKVHTKVRKKK